MKIMIENRFDHNLILIELRHAWHLYIYYIQVYVIRFLYFIIADIYTRLYGEGWIRNATWNEYPSK